MPHTARFTPTTLMQMVPHLRTVIDLTDTNRYYDSYEFISEGVEYMKVNIPGQGKLPPVSKLNWFYRIVDEFLAKYSSDSDALLGVHCTHGLNRTGYLICKYMVDKMKIDCREAIRKFETARGYSIERKVFTDDICHMRPTPESTSQRIHNRPTHIRFNDNDDPRRAFQHNFDAMRRRYGARNLQNGSSTDGNWRIRGPGNMERSAPNASAYGRQERTSWSNYNAYAQQSPLEDCYANSGSSRYGYNRGNRPRRY